MSDAILYGSSTHQGSEWSRYTNLRQKCDRRTNVPFVDDRDRIVAYAQLVAL